MELLDKKLTGPGPEISVHPGVAFFLSFFSFLFFLRHFFWQKTLKLHALQRSTLLYIIKQIFLHHVINNVIRKYNLLFISIAPSLHHIALVFFVTSASCVRCCIINHEKEKIIHYSVNLPNKRNKILPFFIAPFVERFKKTALGKTFW